MALAKKHLRPVKTASASQVARLIRDLDSDDFVRRKGATKELADLGESAVPELRRALGAGPSAEVRRTIEQLLEAASQDSTQRVRQRRLLELVEWIGGAEASGLLTELAQGAPGTWLTREAEGGLRRLGQSGKGGH